MIVILFKHLLNVNTLTKVRETDFINVSIVLISFRNIDMVNRVSITSSYFDTYSIISSIVIEN
jgi:hypothetical protein